MRQMTGREYEQACAAMLKARGYRHVRLTPPSGDQGIDILAERGGKLYGIQCKYYQGPVGNKAVQEAISGSIYYECDRAVVMTNSTFTKSAIELAKSAKVKLWDEREPKAPSSYLISKFKMFQIINILLIAIAVGVLIMWKLMPSMFLNMFPNTLSANLRAGGTHVTAGLVALIFGCLFGLVNTLWLFPDLFAMAGYLFAAAQYIALRGRDAISANLIDKIIFFIPLALAILTALHFIRLIIVKIMMRSVPDDDDDEEINDTPEFEPDED